MRTWAIKPLLLGLVLGMVTDSAAQFKIRDVSSGFSSGILQAGPFGVRMSLGEPVSGLTFGEFFNIGSGFMYSDAEAKVPQAIEMELAIPGEIPAEFQLDQNYPNPFNPSTSIVISLPTRVSARLEIYNIIGQLVSVLVDEELPAGKHRISWNARDSIGRQVASGLYVYRLVAGEFSATRTMTLLK